MTGSEMFTESFTHLNEIFVERKQTERILIPKPHPRTIQSSKNFRNSPLDSYG